MTRRWALRLVIGAPSVLALGFVAWGGYWASQRIREVGAARGSFSAFVATVSQGHIEDAYRGAAPELRCRMSLGQFRGLAGYYAKLQPGPHADVALKHGWPAVHTADVEVATHYDQDIPHHAAMVKLDGAWRLAWIDRRPATEVQARDRKCGERSMHIEMIRQPLRDLLDGLERGDYGALAARFHASRGRTAASLDEAYAPLKAHTAALKEALGAEPVFESAPVEKDGGWSLAAALRAQSVRVSIRADLVFDGAWTLTRFDVDAATVAN
jgi:hypothetical protein